MHLLINRFFEISLGEVHRYEGTINQFLGDGFMALFGAPIAHEDHARRSVLASLGLQKAIRDRRADLGERYGIELKIRIGLNTGPAVAGVIGKRKFTYDLWGDAVNTASRMESHGLTGEIQLTEATYQRLRGNYVLESRGPVVIKGKGEMTTWWLRGRGAAP